MEAIKKTWNGFFATRRLDQLWYELQNKKQRNQQFQTEFKQFVGDFLQEMTAHDEQPAIVDIFAYRDAFLELILEQAVESYQNSKGSTMMDDDIFNTFAHSLVHVVRDMQGASQPFESYIPVCLCLVKCISLEQKEVRLKRMLKLLHILFTSVDQLKVHMVR